MRQERSFGNARILVRARKYGKKPRKVNTSLLVERKTRTQNIPPGYVAIGRWS